MATKTSSPPTISPDEFKLCVLLNSRTGVEANPDLLLAMRRVMVEGLSQSDARKDLELSKQSLFNSLARMNAHYTSRIKAFTAEQFDLGVSVVCPEISTRAKTLARTHLVDPESDPPAGTSDTANEAREAIAKLRSFHLRTLIAYPPK